MNNIFVNKSGAKIQKIIFTSAISTKIFGLLRNIN